MAAGQIEAAKHHLRLAGTCPGSPQPTTFGPNLAFADDLIAAGEVDAALEYLSAVRG